MRMTELLIAAVEREAPRTRRVLEQVPVGRDDWRPHEKSMPLGRLAGTVATMPSWINLVLEQDELDLTPPPGQGQYHPTPTDALASTHDALVEKALGALAATNDDHLMTTTWRLRAMGQIVMEELRHIVLLDTISHLSHHRGQLTVYLRLLGRTVPSVYGPSADDPRFL
ncbi:MAG: damage-inducible protein DinB [Acidobacteria bacterium]|nr:damage-inducible protein DinB [Acidobacteriota bacterium]